MDELSIGRRLAENLRLIQRARPANLAALRPDTEGPSAIDFVAYPLNLAAAAVDYEILHQGAMLLLNDSNPADTPIVTFAFHRNEPNGIRLGIGDSITFRRNFRRIFLSWQAQAGITGSVSLVIFDVGVIERVGGLK